MDRYKNLISCANSLLAKTEDELLNKYQNYIDEVQACLTDVINVMEGDDYPEKFEELYQELDNALYIARTEFRFCPSCEKGSKRSDMVYTKDCHGITRRLVCHDCYTKIMAKGYDGTYYDEQDENLEIDNL